MNAEQRFLTILKEYFQVELELLAKQEQHMAHRYDVSGITIQEALSLKDLHIGNIHKKRTLLRAIEALSGAMYAKDIIAP